MPLSLPDGSVSVNCVGLYRTGCEFANYAVGVAFQSPVVAAQQRTLGTLTQITSYREAVKFNR